MYEYYHHELSDTLIQNVGGIGEQDEAGQADCQTVQEVEGLSPVPPPLVSPSSVST